MLRKFISAILAIVVFFCHTQIGSMESFDDSGTGALTYDDYEYTVLEDETVEITKYQGTETEIVVPSVIDEKPVTSIGKLSFCFKTITSVFIPDSVLSIGESAFYMCESLEEINLPDSIISIDRCAFAYCKSLKEIAIPDGISILREATFTDCRELNSVIIPESITVLERMVFYDCKKLAEISIPDTVISIGANAFGNTLWLNNRQNEDPLVVINRILIDGKKSSGDINVPGGVKIIGNNAFEGNRNIKAVTLPYGLMDIAQDAFLNCTQLVSINISNTVQNIGNRALFHCLNMMSVVIPKSVMEIGEYAIGYYQKSSPTSEEITYEKIDGFTIYCYKDSVGEEYAQNNGFDYILIDSVPVTRFAGKDRFATAVEISKAYFDQADTVVLTNGYSYADALAGVPLADKLNAPILLTGSSTLEAVTLAEIRRLDSKNVIILGGENAIDCSVEKELQTMGIMTERIAGETRFETATKVAEKLNDNPTDVFFVYGYNYADALSISAIAALKDAPIIYLTTDGELNTDTVRYLEELNHKNCVKNAYIIGGSSVISDNMMELATAALGLESATRIAGKDRFETCIAINCAFDDILYSKSVCVATGLNFPDALSGGVFAAKKSAPLFLAARNLTDSQIAYLKTAKAQDIFVFGGTGALSDNLVDKIAKAAAE